METENSPYQRYQRQLILEGFGHEGQQKLLQARVLVIGAGGLGCPALQYLAAAGVGTIGIADDDSVALHNLHRQVLYTTADIGQKKAAVAAARLLQMNPELHINSYAVRLSNQNICAYIRNYDLVLDATDNFASRYLISDACVVLKKPLVYGAVSRFEGQAAIFNAGPNSVNYRDLFPEPPAPGTVLNCAEAGVLGVLPGIIGTVQATEVLKLLTGMGKPLVNRLFTYNALTNESYIFDLPPTNATPPVLPKTEWELQNTNYEWFCHTPAAEEIDNSIFNELIQQENVLVIDVREKDEKPVITEFACRQIPLGSIQESSPTITHEIVILVCQSGQRSQVAAGLLQNSSNRPKKLYSLTGGIVAWKNLQYGKEA